MEIQVKRQDKVGRKIADCDCSCSSCGHNRYDPSLAPTLASASIERNPDLAKQFAQFSADTIATLVGPEGQK